MSAPPRVETPTAPEPRIGDIWRDVDPRFTRYVWVRSIGQVAALIVKVRQLKDGDWQIAPRSRETWAMLKRFNGKRGGYALHERAEGP